VKAFIAASGPLIQRAVSNGAISSTASTLYSASSRETSTSSCNWPTTPTIHCAPISG
jgi:hypothetical protein